MKSYKQLRKEFDEKVKELQKKCQHKKSEWMLTEWSWNSISIENDIVRVCDFCHKTIEKKKPTREEIRKLFRWKRFV